MAYRWNLKPADLIGDPQVEHSHGTWVARLLAARGLAADFLEPPLPTAAEWGAVPGLTAAAERLLDARDHGERVAVVSDGDADGVAAAALIIIALGEAGWRVLDPAGDGQAAGVLLVLGDSGQSEGHSLVLPVHGPGGIDPLALPVGHPLRALPVAAVAWLLVAEAYRRLGLAPPERVLSLVAVGAILGRMRLTGVCRALVRHGLARIAADPHPGLAWLLARHWSADAPPKPRDLAAHLIAKLAPIGRLEEPGIAVALLAASDIAAAEGAGLRFEQAAESVREAFEAVVQSAIARFEEQSALDRTRALVLADPDWPPTALAAAAHRLVERTHGPVVLIAVGEPCRGFGDAPCEIDLGESLALVAPLLGHWWVRAHRCAFSLPPANLEALRLALGRTLARHMPPPERELHADLVLDARTANLSECLDEIWLQMAACEPFGPGNPRPRIAVRNLTTTLQISRDGRHLDCRLAGRTLRLRGQADRHEALSAHSHFDVLFEMEYWAGGKDPWWGRARDLRPADPQSVTCLDTDLEVIDGRGERHAPSADLVLDDWPLWPAQLGASLRRVRPRTVALIGAPTAQEVLVGAAECSLSGQLAGLSDEETRRAVGELVEEARAFQQWLASAPIAEVSALCRRLLIDE